MSSALLFCCYIIIALTAILFVLPPSGAQNSQEDYVNAHNEARRSVGVGPLKWNETLAADAQSYAERRIGDCRLVHSGGRYGENLATGNGSFTGVDAVRLWVNERADYDYKSNSCARGKECTHYTQVVWRNTFLLGCARVRCRNGWWFIICFYAPRGNIIGQHPY